MTMSRYVLIVGNKNYSSWSLRPWILMKQAGIAFEERRIPLYGETSKAQILQVSPSGKVPALLDGNLAIWDSLAIAEYLNEQHPELGLWPADSTARAHARSISAEMHSGFAALRSNMSMNCRKSFPGMGHTPAVDAEIDRIQQIWSDCRQRADGPFLFGRFSIADAMYVPVVLRFKTYAVQLSPSARKYADTILELPALQDWIAAAILETEVLAQFEPAAAP